MAGPAVIWQDGDPWGVLDEQVAAADGVTVVSLSETARLLDVTAGRHLRYLLEGGHRMVDHRWLTLRHHRAGSTWKGHRVGRWVPGCALSWQGLHGAWATELWGQCEPP